jgi:tRNA-specific 2-thiouridylase
MTGKKKVFAAISGGVDSSTATALLLKDGFECEGIYMITCDKGVQGQLDAQKVADSLSIKLHVIDMRKEFEEKILKYFFDEYKHARTPNPCVACNRMIKFGLLFDYAMEHGANFFATGHYVQVLEGKDGWGLYETDNIEKDQSYALAMIRKEVLKHLIFPLGKYKKEQTRELAKQFALPTAHKEESQEICFIPNDDYVSVLEERYAQLAAKGNIVNSSGKILGRHSGIHRFTIGQRRGLNVAMGTPHYVVKLNAADNTVILGPKEDVMSKKLLATNVNWLIDKPTEQIKARVKIRYNNRGEQAIVQIDGDKAVVEFEKSVLAVTPGQLAVFYRQDELGHKVLGGGWIEKSLD